MSGKSSVKKSHEWGTDNITKEGTHRAGAGEASSRKSRDVRQARPPELLLEHRPIKSHQLELIRKKIEADPDENENV